MDLAGDGPRPLGAGRSVELGDGLAGRLARWLADARVAEAARARARERSLRAQAGEEGTVAGVAADLLEAAATVTVRTRGGGHRSGRVRAVGTDFVAVGPAEGRAGVALVALRAVASVRTRPGVATVAGDRGVTGGGRLADVLSGLAAEREPAQIVTADGEVVRGEVRAVGRDVVTVRTALRPPACAYVPLAAIDEVVVEG